MISTNTVNPTRGCAAYVTTYQALGCDKAKVNQQEFRKHRYILVLDEPHHVEEGSAWEEALRPLVERAVLVVLMSGTFARGDGAPMAFLPYTADDAGIVIDFTPTDARAIIRYGLREAWQDQAIIGMQVHYANCQARWRDRKGVVRAVQSLAEAGADTNAALFTALHTAAAESLLEMGVRAWEDHRNGNPRAKLLVVAATISQARRYWHWLVAHAVPAEIATSEDSNQAHHTIKRFKRQGTGSLPAIVTVAMAYEGLDVPAITHLICLTNIRSQPWIEQMIHRATRVDPGAGPYESQCAQIYAPDDAPFRRCVEMMLREYQAYLVSAGQDSSSDDEEARWGLEGGGPPVGINPLASTLIGVRQSALWAKHEAGDDWTEPDWDEVLTPHERIGGLRERIEKQVRRYEANYRVKNGTVNGLIRRKFGKGRADMTEQELRKVLDWVERFYVLRR